MGLALGRLPDGTQLVWKESLLERRKGQIRTGEDSVYGMGLLVNTQYGIRWSVMAAACSATRAT